MVRDHRQRWKLILKTLKRTGYHALMADDLLLGALVNQNQAHWIALVKHGGLLWHVDSCGSPCPMGEESFREDLRAYPSTFAVAYAEHRD